MQVKTQRVPLGSGVRTSTTASVRQYDPVSDGVRIYLDVTQASGTGGLTLQIRGYDPASGLTAVLFAAPAAITATGMNVYEMVADSVSAASGDVKAAISRGLPLYWDVNVLHGDGSAYTYSVGAEIFS